MVSVFFAVYTIGEKPVVILDTYISAMQVHTYTKTEPKITLNKNTTVLGNMYYNINMLITKRDFSFVIFCLEYTVLYRIQVGVLFIIIIGESKSILACTVAPVAQRYLVTL